MGGLRYPISDTGLSVVYSPEEGSPILDIVIVHGLQGHPFKTWASTKTLKVASPTQSSLEVSRDAKKGHTNILRRMVSKASAKSSEIVTSRRPNNVAPLVGWNTNNDSSLVFWPGDLIPQDCPRSRILVYGYDTKVTKYGTSSTNKNHVLSHGKDLLYALGRDRPPDRPLIFLAHSLGGIVVKEALAASFASSESEMKNVIQSTAGVIFLGTPHRGSSGFSDLGERARMILSAFRMETNPAILDTLGLKTSDLERAQESFSILWHKYDFRVKTFQEGLGLTGVNFSVLGDKVVPNHSSLLGDYRERAETIQANHMEMCRFKGADDPNYLKVAGELRSIYQSLQQLNEPSTSENTGIHGPTLLSGNDSLAKESEGGSRAAAKYLLEKLKFPAMGSRYQTLPKPADNTCSWLFQQETFQEWLHGRNTESHRGLFLLRGKPGAGKSVLMKETHRRISLSQVGFNYTTATFFFHAQGQELERSPTGMFRSLLYQILPTHPEELHRFRTQWNNNNTPFSDEDFKVFFKTMFAKPQNRTTFIFIDAIDECGDENGRSLALFWRGITLTAFERGAKLNVLMSTRHYPHFSLSNCSELWVDSCNQQDIALYIEQITKLVAMPEQTLVSLKDFLVEESRGVFLWVVLTVEKLLGRLENGERLSTLMGERTHLPRRLNDLFAEILASVDAEQKRLTNRLFQWASLTVEPLRLHEWHHILAFIRQPKFHSLQEWRESAYFTEDDEQLERLIKSLSRGLLQVRAVSTGYDAGHETGSTSAGAGSLDRSYGETRVVEFIHESVREFVLKPEGRYSFTNEADGHLQIVETCLDYLDIYELDALVEARDRLMLLRKNFTEGNHLMEEPKNSDVPRGNQVTESDLEDEECRQGSLAPGREEPAEQPFENALETLPTTTGGIDIDQWITSSQIYLRQNSSDESPRSSAGRHSYRPSTAIQSQVLQDHPALLSYATFKLFWHALRAQLANTDPEDIVRRLQMRSWDRWLLLSEVKAPQFELYEIFRGERFFRWYQILRPDTHTQSFSDQTDTKSVSDQTDTESVSRRKYEQMDTESAFRRRYDAAGFSLALPILHLGSPNGSVESFGSASSHGSSQSFEEGHTRHQAKSHYSRPLSNRPCHTYRTLCEAWYGYKGRRQEQDLVLL